MSRRRARKSAGRTPLKKDAKGRVLCRWCEEVVTPPRRTYCSDACVHEWRLRSSPAYMRAQVLKRDDGRCATCGLDAVALAHELAILRRKDHAAWSEWFRANKVSPRRKTFWDAHHALAVVEGGGECSLSKMISLCIFCHRKETAALARRRAGKD